jgi:hypothetical protein
VISSDVPRPASRQLAKVLWAAKGADGSEFEVLYRLGFILSNAWTIRKACGMIDLWISMILTRGEFGISSGFEFICITTSTIRKGHGIIELGRGMILISSEFVASSGFEFVLSSALGGRKA